MVQSARRLSGGVCTAFKAPDIQVLLAVTVSVHQTGTCRELFRPGIRLLVARSRAFAGHFTNRAPS